MQSKWFFVAIGLVISCYGNDINKKNSNVFGIQNSSEQSSVYKKLLSKPQAKLFDRRDHDEERKTSDEAWRMLGIDPAVAREKRRDNANNKRIEKMFIVGRKENGIKIIIKTHTRKNKFNCIN